MKPLPLLLLALSLTYPLSADVIHVTAREYLLKPRGKEEPVWEQHGKDQVWTRESQGVHGNSNAPKFPDVEGASTIEEEVRFSATKSGRGRIVISLTEGEKQLAQAQDNSFGDSCALSYTHTTGGGIFKIEILVWTHP